MSQNILQVLGLDSQEQKIYMTLLREGKKTATGVAQATGLKRTTVYPYIEELLRRDMIRRVIYGKRRYYAAEHPGRLHAKFEQQKRVFENQLPSLLDLYSESSDEPNVSSFYGIDGLNAAKADIKENANYLKTIFSPGQYYKSFDRQETRRFAQALAARGVKLQSLYPDDESGRELYKIEREFGFKTKFLPKDYKSTVNVLIYNQKVALISYENLFGVVIDNADIAKAHEEMFDHIWKTI